MSALYGIVPLIVQTAANAILRFRNRDIDTLLMLPGQRENPAFIMDYSGKVVLSAGKTVQLFKIKAITKITDLIGTDGFDRLIKKLDHSSGKHFY